MLRKHPEIFVKTNAFRLNFCFSKIRKQCRILSAIWKIVKKIKEGTRLSSLWDFKRLYAWNVFKSLRT